jgi:hypothetical protein
MPQFLFIVALHFKGGIFCCFSENIKIQHLPVLFAISIIFTGTEQIENRNDDEGEFTSIAEEQQMRSLVFNSSGPAALSTET